MGTLSVLVSFREEGCLVGWEERDLPWQGKTQTGCSKLHNNGSAPGSTQGTTEVGGVSQGPTEGGPWSRTLPSLFSSQFGRELTHMPKTHLKPMTSKNCFTFQLSVLTPRGLINTH